MSPLDIVVAVILVVAVIEGIELFARRPYRRIIRRRVVVSLEGGDTFTGILLSHHGPLLHLADAAAVNGGREVEVDGELVVERDRVRWIQVVAA